MKTISQTLGVARSNVIERRDDRKRAEGRKNAQATSSSPA